MEKKITNDEKRKKVIDELERRKKISDKYLDSVDDSSKDFDHYEYACHKSWNFIISNALNFVKEDTIKYNGCDYSNYKSYCESIDECSKKSPFLIMYRIARGDFNAVVSYIGIVIDDINDNFYPVDSYKIFEEMEW